MDNFSDNVQIEVVTHYLDSQSDPASNRYVFSYKITITNHNSKPVQLLRRYWRIVDGNENVQEVEGEGVVGEQPVIESGKSYIYSSGAVLATHVGSMQGHYQLKSEDGTLFDSPISPFTLAQPNALH